MESGGTVFYVQELSNTLPIIPPTDGNPGGSGDIQTPPPVDNPVENPDNLIPPTPNTPPEDGETVETRVAVMSIIVESGDAAETLNALFHAYRDYIIGRMGLPYREKNISIISVAVDAPQDVISALSGKVGKVPGVSVKTAYSRVASHG